jgi:hypothetical protein
MKNIAKLFILICVFCPVLSAEPNLNEDKAAGEPNIISRNVQRNELRMQRLRQRANMPQAETGRRSISGEKLARNRRLYERQINQEYAKNQKRISILTRIKELAESTNQLEKAKKAESLIQIENIRYRKQVIKLQKHIIVSARDLNQTEPNSNQEQK